MPGIRIPETAPTAATEAFFDPSSRRTGLTLAFDEITSLRPARVSVNDPASGALIDPFDISSYAIATAQYTIPKNSDAKRSIYANLRREFFSESKPVTLKGGFDLQNAIRDDTRTVHPSNILFDYVGRDGRPSSSPAAGDDQASPFFYAAIADRPGEFGFPSIPVLSNALLWQHDKNNPTEFREDPNTTYRNAVTPSKRAEETVTSLYLRGDVQFFAHRLKLVGGLRAEQTNIHAEGPLTDPTGNFRRRADGSFILGDNGRPLRRRADRAAGERREPGSFEAEMQHLTAGARNARWAGVDPAALRHALAA